MGLNNRILCTRRCNVSQEFFLVPGASHTESVPRLLERQRHRLLDADYTDEDLACPEVEIDYDIPEAGKLAFWKGTHTAMVRARVTYKGQFYCYLLQDSIGWPWIQVQKLTLMEG